MAELELLFHNSAPAHTALTLQQFLAAKSTIVMPHTSYLPHLSTCHFLLFQKNEIAATIASLPPYP